MKCQYMGLFLTYVLGMLVSEVWAADVELTVNGMIVARPCTVSTPNSTVDLGQLNTFDFVEVNSSSEWKNLEMNLTNCPIGTTKITTDFSGTMDSIGHYKNQGTAENVQIEMQDTDGRVLDDGTSKLVEVDPSGNGKFLLKIRAVSATGKPSQGSISATIIVSYTYA